MKKQKDKMMTDLHRLLETQNFKSEEELKVFLDSLIGQKLPEFPDDTLNNEERAQDLIYAAYDLSPIKAKRHIEQALVLDPECISAYELLGSLEDSPVIAAVFYEKGIAIGEKKFGGEYLKENVGMFWGLIETRPYMLCLLHEADCLYTMGKRKQCIAILEKMIKLNPHDNQGVRDQLLLYLIEEKEEQKFKKYDKQFKDDGMAFARFNRALFAFSTKGESTESNKLLKKAIAQNIHVVPKLLSSRPSRRLPDTYGFGDENEANYYMHFAYPVWYQIPGAIEWLKSETKENR